MTQQGLSEGWWWPMNSRKAHYIGPDGRSLCRKWQSWAPVVRLELEAPDSPPSRDDCAACRRKLEKRQAGVTIGGER